MDRLRWLDDLVNFLKVSPDLNGHGISGIPDLNGSNIFVHGDYSGFETLNNFFHGLIISPLGARPVQDLDCATSVEHDVLLGAMMKDDRAIPAHFQENIQGGVTSFTGAYPQASKFEYQVRKAMLAFNEALHNNLIGNNWQYQPFTLVDMPEPYLHNGLIVMRSLYRTKYVY